MVGIGEQEIFTLLQLHLNDEGKVIDTDDHNTYFDSKHKPVVYTPFSPSLQTLVDLFQAIEICTQHNRDCALLTFGAVAMNSHHQTIVEEKGGAPIVVLYGQPDTCKTLTTAAVLSILGIEKCIYRGTRREYFVHLAAQTSLGLMYDDPNRVQEVENVIVDFHNAIKRGSFVRGTEKPCCGIIIACNFTLGKIQR